MAKTIAAVFRTNAKTKMLVVVGNPHVLKKPDWQGQVPNKHRAIREYLADLMPRRK